MSKGTTRGCRDASTSASLLHHASLQQPSADGAKCSAVRANDHAGPGGAGCRSVAADDRRKDERLMVIQKLAGRFGNRVHGVDASCL